MRKEICALLLLSTIALMGRSQETLVPKKNIVAKKWVKAQSYQMNWWLLKDTARIAIGNVVTNVEVLGDRIQVISTVKLNQSTSPWIDTTIVRKADLAPIYHASTNAQRNMSIQFGKHISGFYLDKATSVKTEIAQTIPQGYFDSNFYPILIGWLPLKPGYQSDISIYDYHPKGKTGVIKAHILGVTAGSYLSKKLGQRKVWVVEVNDEIGGSNNSRVIYQIDQQTRQLYQQSIATNGRRMEMVLVEN